MARGNGRQNIVHDDGDRQPLIDDLARTVARSDWQLLSFVVLSNHLHLLLKTPRPNLARGMQAFLSAYAVYAARRRRTHRTRVQGRYRAEMIEDESYFWTVSRYIHLNPVRAGLVPARTVGVVELPRLCRSVAALSVGPHDAYARVVAGGLGRGRPGSRLPQVRRGRPAAPLSPRRSARRSAGGYWGRPRSLLSCAAWPVPSSPTHRPPKRSPWPLSRLTTSATRLCVITDSNPTTRHTR